MNGLFHGVLQVGIAQQYLGAYDAAIRLVGEQPAVRKGGTAIETSNATSIKAGRAGGQRGDVQIRVIINVGDGVTLEAPLVFQNFGHEDVAGGTFHTVDFAEGDHQAQHIQKSAFDTSCGNSFNKVFLCAEENDRSRKQRYCCHCKHLVPICRTGSVQRHTQSQNNRIFAHAVDIDQRIEEIIPCPYKLENRRREQTRLAKRKQDAPIYLEGIAAVNNGRLI